MKTKVKGYFFAITLGLIGFSSATAQVEKFEALFMYNFAQNTSWENVGDEELIITVVSNQDIASILKTMAKSKTVGARKVVIKEVENINEVTPSQIIYIGDSKVKEISSLYAYVKKDDALVISGKAGQCKVGADISFKMESGKLRYEINTKTIDAKKLKITSYNFV